GHGTPVIRPASAGGLRETIVAWKRARTGKCHPTRRAHRGERRSYRRGGDRASAASAAWSGGPGGNGPRPGIPHSDRRCTRLRVTAPTYVVFSAARDRAPLDPSFG